MGNAPIYEQIDMHMAVVSCSSKATSRVILALKEKEITVQKEKFQLSGLNSVIFHQRHTNVCAYEVNDTPSEWKQLLKAKVKSNKINVIILAINALELENEVVETYDREQCNRIMKHWMRNLDLNRLTDGNSLDSINSVITSIYEFSVSPWPTKADVYRRLINDIYPKQISEDEQTCLLGVYTDIENLDSPSLKFEENKKIMTALNLDELPTDIWFIQHPGNGTGDMLEANVDTKTSVEVENRDRKESGTDDLWDLMDWCIHEWREMSGNNAIVKDGCREW